ncbi:MAG: hypothetical protein RMK89_10780 [Armatimonadota bacterium]|nr:hypothetical protein [Armatimonadota bacterium]MDW8143933.1 hypothetical protein [Armatimonadota bacterium]
MEVLFGTEDPSIRGSCLVCDHRGYRGSVGVPWRLGLGDLVSWSHPASLTAILPIQIGSEKAVILGVDGSSGHVDLNNRERWRINCSARPIGVWLLKGFQNSKPDDSLQILACLDSGYLLLLNFKGELVARKYLGQPIRQGIQYADGTMLALANRLFVVPNGQIEHAFEVTLPLQVQVPADVAHKPAFAHQSGGFASLFLMP